MVKALSGRRERTGKPRAPDPVVVRGFVEDRERVESCRARLGNLSWLMRCLNEPIAWRGGGNTHGIELRVGQHLVVTLEGLRDIEGFRDRFEPGLGSLRGK